MVAKRTEASSKKAKNDQEDEPKSVERYQLIPADRRRHKDENAMQKKILQYGSSQLLKKTGQ
jgi:hypothetical protein